MSVSLWMLDHNGGDNKDDDLTFIYYTEKLKDLEGNLNANTHTTKPPNQRKKISS